MFIRDSTSAVGIVAKSWDYHVLEALQTTLEEGEAMIADSVAYLHGAGRRVPVSYTHLRAHETVLDLVCRLLLEKKKSTHTLSHPHVRPILVRSIHQSYDHQQSHTYLTTT